MNLDQEPIKFGQGKLSIQISDISYRWAINDYASFNMILVP